MSVTDIDFLVMFLGYFLLTIAGVGVVFMLDAFLFGLTGISFLGWIDKYVLRG